jgi:hypothetical protein
MSTANSHLINSGDSEHAWMVILLTDGQGTYSNTYTQQAINNNITETTVSLGSDVDTALLTNIATSTGGQNFSVSTAEDLPDVFRTISEEIEPTDTDGDRLSDSEDEYPLSPSSIEPEIGVLEIGRAIVLGAVFGECGIEGGSLAGSVDSEIASYVFSRERPLSCVERDKDGSV